MTPKRRGEAGEKQAPAVALFSFENRINSATHPVMRLHVLSDLHLEFGSATVPDTDAEVVVLAGDIHIGTRSLLMYAVTGALQGMGEAMREP